MIFALWYSGLQHHVVIAVIEQHVRNSTVAIFFPLKMKIHNLHTIIIQKTMLLSLTSLKLPNFIPNHITVIIIIFIIIIMSTSCHSCAV